jgi:uroporphyrinogen decarboxylase
VLAALRHETPDRVPMDLGGGRASSIHLTAYRNLAKKLGLAVPPPEILDVMQQVAGVHGSVQDALDVDIEFVNTDPAVVLDGDEIGTHYTDEWGVTRRMPEDGLYYDQDTGPLAGEITVADIAKHPWPDPHDAERTRGLRERVQAARDGSDRAVCMGVRGSIVHLSQYLRGFEDWYYDMAGDQEVIGALLDALLEVLLPVIDAQLKAAGDLCDIIFLGDDIGAQNGLQVSPDTYRKVIMPRHRKVFEAVRRGAPEAFIGMHTCGSVVDVIDDLIEIGVQVLNPIQVSARDMEPRALKERFGDRLSFWGAMDTQQTLPFGTEDEVRAEVRDRVGVLGEGGGYILSAVHNVQPDVPTENLLAMFDEARSFRPELVIG